MCIKTNMCKSKDTKNEMQQKEVKQTSTFTSSGVVKADAVMTALLRNEKKPIFDIIYIILDQLLHFSIFFIIDLSLYQSQIVFERLKFSYLLIGSFFSLF